MICPEEVTVQVETPQIESLLAITSGVLEGMYPYLYPKTLSEHTLLDSANLSPRTDQRELHCRY